MSFFSNLTSTIASWSAPQIAGAVAALGTSLYALRQYAIGGVCKSKADLTGKTVIITGANTGIGYETALDLAKRHAKVILACRNAELMNQAIANIRQASGNNNVIGHVLDLTNFQSVRKFAQVILDTEPAIHILINNAGVMALPNRVETAEKTEMQMQTNHFGHHLLTNLLLDRIKASAPARIVVLSSKAHYRASSINFEDIHFQKAYSSIDVYQQTKLANTLFANELSRKLEGTGVTVNSLHPGVVVTELGRHLPWFFKVLAVPFLILLKTPKQGAQTSIFAAVDESMEGVSGAYLSDCAIVEPNKVAKDAGVAKKLWDLSDRICGL